jgi:hypothetical protein
MVRNAINLSILGVRHHGVDAPLNLVVCVPSWREKLD